MSITLENSSELKNLDLDEIEEEKTVFLKQITDLGQNNRLDNQIGSTAFTDKNDMSVNTICDDVTYMYGYIAYGGSSGHPEGPCKFPIDDPGNIESLGGTQSAYYLNGGTWSCIGKWFCCEYNTGSLWVIYPETGDMYQIGGGGTVCNGLAWDPVSNRLYGASSTSLLEYDPETGEQEFIGSFGLSGITIGGMAINIEGECYIWDIVWSGSSKLYKLDLETLEVTEVCNMGVSLTYSTGGCFDWETGLLYLTSYYVSGGYLASFNIETYEYTLIGYFEGGAEITATMIKFQCWDYEHDVGVHTVIFPKSGDACNDMNVTLELKNYGNVTEEDIPVNVVILKDGVDEEYNETVYVETLEPGENVFIELPAWTPNDWQSAYNEYINYSVIAHTSLGSDANPVNDKKEKEIMLYFGYFHDIELTKIDSPYKDGPGKIYPVQVTIKNVGQYAECCISIDINISDLNSDYSDNVCLSDYLEPGESKTFDFDDWTPDFLEYETTGSTDHIVHAEIYTPGDENPVNDMKTEYFTLDYWHDVGIDRISSPNGITRKQDLLWHNGEPDGRYALQGSMYEGYSNIVIDDFETDWTWEVKGGEFRFIWYSGYSIGNLETVRVYFFEETDNCDPSLEAWAEVEVTAFNEYTTGDYYFGRPEIAVDVEFDKVELYAGKWWVGFQPEGITDDIAYLLTAEGWGECDVMADLPYWEYPRWSSSQEIWGEGYDLSWLLYTYGYTPRNIYIQPGPQNISVIAKNYGTFPELNLVCNAQIWDYIFDPNNGTKLYEENETDIDLDTPLGSEVLLNFEQFTFEYEGRYGLRFAMPDDNDDFPRNNKKGYGICVDNTAPISTHELYPSYPDGHDGWYVDDVEVILQSYDPYVKDVSSGVKEVKYKVNDGPIETIDWGWGKFDLTQEDEGDDVLVEYWAIDNVGNEETPHNTFTIDMDQTCPGINLTYEITGGNPIEGWIVLCTATATDDTSGMDRVEYFLNYKIQDVVDGSGPEYQWGFTYHGGLNLVVTVWGFDKAGNMASDEIDHVKNSYNQNTKQQTQSSKSSYFMLNLYKGYCL